MLTIITIFVFSILANFFLYQQIKDFQSIIKKWSVKYYSMRNNYHNEVKIRRINETLSDKVISERDEYKHNFDYVNMKYNRLMRLMRNRK